MESNNWSGIGLIIGGPILALGYNATFSYLYPKHSSHFLFRGFESIGKVTLLIQMTALFKISYNFCSFISSRSFAFKNLPTDVFGISLRNTTSSGTHHFAN